MQSPTIDSSGSRFDLFANAFYLLGIDPTASDSQVHSAYAAAIKQNPAATQVLEDARAAIMDPSRRLSCDLSYPIDSSPAQIQSLYAKLLGNLSTQEALTYAEQLAPLSRANFLAHVAASGPVGSALLLALLDAHVDVAVPELYGVLKTLRNKAGWPTPSLVKVSDGLRDLLGQHSMAVILGCGDVENAARPVLECIRSILATGQPYRIEALTVLLDAYRQASAERRSELDHELHDTCAALQEMPDTPSAIHDFTETMDRWISLYRPLILLDEHRLHRDPNVQIAISRIRRLLAGVSIEQRYLTTKTLIDLASAASSCSPADIEQFSRAAIFFQNSAIERRIEPLGDLYDQPERDPPRLMGAFETAMARHAKDTSANPAVLSSPRDSLDHIKAQPTTVREKRRTFRTSVKWLAIICAALFGGAVGVSVYQFYIASPRSSGIVAAAESSAPALGPEMLPPVGKGQHLTQDYVRYCRFQEERLRIIKGKVQGTDDTGAFNALANDYNSRCANFFYLDDDLKIVNEELVAKQQILEDSALRIMATWPWRASSQRPPAK